MIFAAAALRLAAVELPYANEATRELLLRALHDRDRIQRIRAVEALMDAGDPRNAAPIAEIARTDAVPAVRNQAASSAAPPPISDAAFVPRPAPPPEAYTFTQPDPRLRREARLRALRDDPSFVSDFRPLLDDPDYFVRRAVSEETVRRRGTAVAPQWRELFASTNTDLRVEAAWAAGELRDAPSEPPLIECLSSPSERLRLLAVSALARVGGDATRAALPMALERAEDATREALIPLAVGLKASAALPNLRAIAHQPPPEGAHRSLDVHGDPDQPHRLLVAIQSTRPGPLPRGRLVHGRIRWPAPDHRRRRDLEPDPLFGSAAGL
ncbi:MAG: HEAT repeat domain-containing protein [Verrucomicrobiae bacterium]|nr:HEAT repeat domain-containing protein [Verrucomicrobiae bacterium]